MNEELISIVQDILEKGLDLGDFPVQEYTLMEYIFENYPLSEETILYCLDKNYITWKLVSAFGKLSEDFIRRYKDKLDWRSISFCQELSDKFKEEFKDRIIEEFKFFN